MPSTQTTGALVSGGAAAATTGITAALGTAALASFSWAVPFVGPAIGLVSTFFLANLVNNKRKVQATKIVDELEQVLVRNRDEYLNDPERTTTDQANALREFDLAMAWLASPEGCGDPQLGTPGQRCISDRERNGRWPWAVYYRDPIAQDQPPAPPGVFDGVFGGDGANGGGLLSFFGRGRVDCLGVDVAGIKKG
jgi:hypothetical protein